MVLGVDLAQGMDGPGTGTRLAWHWERGQGL